MRAVSCLTDMPTLGIIYRPRHAAPSKGIRPLLALASQLAAPRTSRRRERTGSVQLAAHPELSR